jgi:hypothetical protein
MTNLCEMHLTANCPLPSCKKAAAPVSIPVVTAQTFSHTVPAVTSTPVPPPAPPTPTPTDPHAAKVLAAAAKYAAACDAHKTLSDEVFNLTERRIDAELRQAVAAKNRDDAQAELMKLMGEKQ